MQNILATAFVALSSVCPVSVQIAGGDEAILSTIPPPIAQESPDRVVVDVARGKGYLVRGDGSCDEFRVITGKKAVVNWIGKTYNAATPIAEWEVSSVETKGDRHVFGKTGKFLRLARAGEDTAYGIHGTANFENMAAAGLKHASMGCVNVSEESLAMIKTAYEQNGGQLEVKTVSAMPETCGTISPNTL